MQCATHLKMASPSFVGPLQDEAGHMHEAGEALESDYVPMKLIAKQLKSHSDGKFVKECLKSGAVSLQVKQSMQLKCIP